jgi:hypothetical protein
VQLDLDAGLKQHGVALDPKHYNPLLQFLQGAQFVLQHMFAPNTCLGGVEKNGGYPPNFVQQSEGRQGWLDLSDEQAAKIIESTPQLLDIAYFRGRPEESELDRAYLPEDASGLRRNELGHLQRERAQHFNSEHELLRRREIEAARVKDAAGKIANAAQRKANKETDKQKADLKKQERLQKAAVKQAATLIKKQRTLFKKELQSTGGFCYCRQADDETYLRCAGGASCHLRAWIHLTCAKERDDCVTDAMLDATQNVPFWCAACVEVRDAKITPAVSVLK